MTYWVGTWKKYQEIKEVWQDKMWKNKNDKINEKWQDVMKTIEIKLIKYEKYLNKNDKYEK